ncbi:hypothetical protein [Streptomyces sp. SD15]
MLTRLRTLGVAGAVCASSLLAAPGAFAEVEPGGWTSVSPTYTVQERGCGQVDGLTFTLTCSTASGDQRAERRYATYTGGTRQFEGYFRVAGLYDKFGAYRTELVIEAGDRCVEQHQVLAQLTPSPV